MGIEERLFLSENYEEEMNNYQEIVSGKKQIGWDWIIITASNEEQKKSYLEQIEYRKKINFFPRDLKIDVIADPNGERVGSGGATINVLKTLSEMDPDFLNKKIMLIHSGGDSKRVPTCSVCGKLFSNIPRKLFNNRCSTLFDEFMISFSNVADRLKNGMIILSGDVLMLFNSLQIDIYEYDIASISIKVPVEIGKNHGVILSDKNNNVLKFLHKLSVDKLKKQGAVDSEGYVDLDTGCIYISPKVEETLLKLIMKDGKVDNKLYKKFVNNINRLSFYGDILYPFAKLSTESEYLTLPAEGEMDDNLIKVRKILWEKLSGYNFGVIKTSPSKYIHTGTTNELINLFINFDKNYPFLNWSKCILSTKDSEKSSYINSIINSNNIHDGILIENSIIEKDAIIEENCLISNTIINNHIYKDTVIHTLPINYNGVLKYVTRIYGINDNPKENTKFLNVDINKITNILKNKNIDSLWDLPIYPVCDSIEESVKYALFLQDVIHDNISNELLEKYLKKDKLSLKESFNLANTTEILKFQEKLEYQILSSLILEDFLVKNKPLEEIFKYLNSNNVVQIVNNIKKKIKKNYRAYLLLSKIVEKYSNMFEVNLNIKYEDMCYDIIKQNVIKNNKIKILKTPKANKKIIKNRFPIRLNFGGGWSDTAPHSLEKGGVVLNTAATLNGKLPICVTVEKNTVNKFIFKSVDANISDECSSIDEFKNLQNIGDVFILSKVSLLLLNINDSILNDYGITITTDVDVPKGSGLGTSSILCAGIIKTLSDFFTLNLNENDIASLVFCAEQMISSGGGWQDQIGGITPGIKLIETQSGLYQKYTINYLNKESKNIKELNDKMVLIYAGQRRIAKNLLRKIMNKFILNDSKTLKILNEIQHIALLMKFELEKGTLEGFNKLLNRHFELIKELDDGVTNLSIDHLINTLREFVVAFFIAGAGGGGFVIAILKDIDKKEQLKQKINNVYKDIGIEVFDTDII